MHIPIFEGVGTAIVTPFDADNKVNFDRFEDLIEFQQIEFQVIKGYVWNGNRDYRIQETIEKVFNSRLKYKAEHNPLEQLYKLIMNSSYGKTIQKPVENDLIFLSKSHSRVHSGPSEYEAYVQKNYNKITS